MAVGNVELASYWWLDDWFLVAHGTFWLGAAAAATKQPERTG